MKMKTTLLTLCLAISLAIIAKWAPSLVSANTTAVVCGQVFGYTPATATTAGSLRLGPTTYAIAPGATIVGQAILKIGANVCLDLTFNNNGEIIPPSKIAGSTVNVCGGVNSFTASTNHTQGAISIGSSSYAIAAGVTIDNQMTISKGANMCLTAALNGAGQIANPSAILANTTSPITACGTVSSYTAATANNTGFISVGGLNFTIGAGVNIGNVSAGSNVCLQGILNVNGQLVTPSSVAANPGGASSVCGVVTAFKGSTGASAGSITVGSVTIPITPALFVPGQNSITEGINVCLSPLVLVNGRISAGSSISAGSGNCLQFTSPLLVHGFSNDPNDTHLLPKPLVFTVSSGAANAGVFNLNPTTYGGFPRFQNNRPQVLTAMSRNTTVRALSCTDSIWDFVFDIATKGETEGDMVTVFVQSPNSSNIQILAMFTVQNGGVILNQLHPDITFLVNSNGPFGVGYFIPLLSPAGASGIRTPPLTLVWSMKPSSPLNACLQLGIDIKRMGGNGMTSVAPHLAVVKRMGVEGDEEFPTGSVCGLVCDGCFLQPTPSPTPTPTPTPTQTPTPTPTTPPLSTPTPTPPPMPIKCDTICYRPPSYFQLRLDYLPNGSILIGGVNFNNPVSIQRSKDQIRIALQGGAGPLQQLNQQFVATQLNFAFAGGTASPVVFNTLWSRLSCSGIDFQPVTLTNGVTLSPDSLLDTLVTQAILAIRQNRTADMVSIAQILALLNSRC